MDINFKSLQGKSFEEIVDQLIQHVTKSDEEIVEEGREEKRTATELKVFIAENQGLEIGNLTSEIEDRRLNDDLNQHEREYFDQHNFDEEPLDGNVSYVQIGTPQYQRKDDFIFVFSDDYLRVLTTVRKQWTEETVEKLIKYLPCLDRVLLSSEDLESMESNLSKTRISGFTAKYKPYYRDQEVTVQFHGAERGDLEKVEREFNALPSRVELSQRNSPADAVQMAARVDGYYSIQTVRQGSEDVGVRSLMELSEDYEERDRQHYSVDESPDKSPLTNREGYQKGVAIEGFTTLELIEQVDDEDEAPSHEELVSNLEENIIEGKRRYVSTTWEDGNYIVFDKQRNEPFEITTDGSNIVVHAKSATTSTTLRDFCEIIREEFNTTYRLEKSAGSLRA